MSRPISPPSPIPTQGSFTSGPGEYGGPVMNLSLGQRIMATTVGNLATVVICGLVYWNYVLFESYVGVFLYAFLVSEALWDTKCMLVGWLQRVNDEENENISLRAELEQWTRQHPLGGWVTWVSVSMYAIGLAVYPLFCTVCSVVIALFMFITYVFDKNVLFLFQIHRWFLDDDTLIALVLIILVFFTGGFLASSFALLVLRDARLAVDLVARAAQDNAYFSEWVNDILQGVSRDGKNAVDQYIDVIEQQYLQNSSWAPVLRWSLQYVDNLTMIADPEKVEVTDTWAERANILMTDPWSLAPSLHYDEFISGIRQLAVDISSSEELLGPLDDLSSYLKENLLSFAGMGVSVLFLIVDFGVRLAFFVTLVLILLSSKEAVLHEFIGGLVETGSEGQKSKFEVQLRNAIEAVFLMPIKMSILNALATLAIYWMFGMKLMFFAASLSLVITIFPIIAPFWVCAPWICVYYAYDVWSLGWSVFVFSMNYIFFYYVNMWVLAGIGSRFFHPEKFEEVEDVDDSVEEMNGSSAKGDKGKSEEESKTVGWSSAFAEITDPELVVGKREYMTGLAVFFGVEAFGAKGALLGPLLVCLALVTYNVVREQHQSVYREQQVLTSPNSSGYPHSLRKSFAPSASLYSQLSSQELENASDEDEDDLVGQLPAVPGSAQKPRGGRMRRHNSTSIHETRKSDGRVARSGLNLLGDLFNMSPARQARPQRVNAESSVSAFHQKLRYLKGMQEEGLISAEQFEEIRTSVVTAFLGTNQGKDASRRFPPIRKVQTTSGMGGLDAEQSGLSPVGKEKTKSKT